MKLASEMLVKKVSVSAKLVDAQIVRRMVIVLARDFGVDLAKSLGGKAKELLDALRSSNCTDVTIDIDAVSARLELHISGSGLPGDLIEDRVVLPRCIGRKAKAVRAKSEDLEPNISLEFESIFDEKAWGWFGRNIGGFATVEIEPAQLELARKAS